MWRISRVAENTARLLLVVIVGLTLISYLPAPAQADDNPVDLELGGKGAVSWDITNIMPGDSGTKPVALRNVGDVDGFVTIWVSDVVSTEGDNPESETGDTAEPGELDRYLLFSISCDRLRSRISLPSTIDNLPQSASNQLRVTPLNVGETVSLDWQWELPVETGNDAQGDRLSFTINYMLEEFPPPAGGGGGGGGGAPAYYLDTDLFSIEESYRISYGGKLRETIEAASADGMVSVSIPKGTLALDEDGERLELLVIAVDETPSPPPQDSRIIGLAYNFEPEGATFDPPISLTWSYNPDALLADVAEENLIIAYYDQAAGKWVECECICDPETHCITACICHFTTFAVIGTIIPPPPLPPPAPAAFSVGSLDILPDKVDIGKTTTISVLVANTGGQLGSYEVTLKINGVVEGSRGITLDAGASGPVVFSISKETAGTFSVDVNGLSGSFTVREKPAPAKPANWSLIGGIVAGVIVVGLGVFFWMRRKGSLATFAEQGKGSSK